MANLWTQQVAYWYSTTMCTLSNRNEGIAAPHLCSSWSL